MLQSKPDNQTEQTSPSVQRKQASNSSPYKSKQGKKPPIQTKEGRKGPIQAKQRPVQRKTKDANLLANVGQLMGADISDTKINYNSSKPAAEGAEAIAQHKTIDLAPNKGHHLPHEAVHIAQQAKGMVKPTGTTPTGSPLNDSPTLEQQADVVGAKAEAMPAPVQMTRSERSASTNATVSSAIVQRAGVVGDVAKDLEEKSLEVAFESWFWRIVHYENLAAFYFGSQEKKETLGKFKELMWKKVDELTTGKKASEHTATLKGTLADNIIIERYIEAVNEVENRTEEEKPTIAKLNRALLYTDREDGYGPPTRMTKDGFVDIAKKSGLAVAGNVFGAAMGPHGQLATLTMLGFDAIRVIYESLKKSGKAIYDINKGTALTRLPDGQEVGNITERERAEKTNPWDVIDSQPLRSAITIGGIQFLNLFISSFGTRGPNPPCHDKFGNEQNSTSIYDGQISPEIQYWLHNFLGETLQKWMKETTESQVYAWGIQALLAIGITVAWLIFQEFANRLRIMFDKNLAEELYTPDHTEVELSSRHAEEVYSSTSSPVSSSSRRRRPANPISGITSTNNINTPF